MRLIVSLLVIILILEIGYAVDVDACQLINAPGTYEVTANLNGANQVTPNMNSIVRTCIAITSDNVIFDCMGIYDINNSGINWASGIAVYNGGEGGPSNVTIRNCRNISNYRIGKIGRASCRERV